MDPSTDTVPAEPTRSPVSSAFGDRRRATLVSRLWISVWLLFLIYPISDIFSNHYPGWKAALLSLWLAVFVVLYLRTMWSAFPDPKQADATGLWGLGLLTAITLPVVVVLGGNWEGGLIYVTVAAGTVLPARWAVTAALGLGALEVFAVWHAGIGILANWDLYLLTAGLGVMMVFWRRMFTLLIELNKAREEVARLAVSDERLRIARDLHDVLGHSLSVITLKAQVARRTMDTDLEGARAAIGDVEQVSRDSLRELREMVAGYREQSLSGELRGAAEVLAAAGIELDVQQTAEHIPKATEGALAWAVREGVSNVLRHSHARRCRITISEANDGVRFEMFDDGVGTRDRAAESNGSGHGLRGLRERMAKVGGTLDAGAVPGGGFRIAASLPGE
ncbi:MAG: sensor histidine kinase [Candidatus Dormibacteraeota bacterium]|nr:sensor histidine kinase [Candidatus Dormibacteraeota bacterium]